jgi:hypothetical protein
MRLVLNMNEPSTLSILMPMRTKLMVSMILLISDHVSIVHIILVPQEDCYLVYSGNPLMSMNNDTGYVYCTAATSGIKQLCPPGTEVDFNMGGCANKTSELIIK